MISRRISSFLSISILKSTIHGNNLACTTSTLPPFQSVQQCLCSINPIPISSSSLLFQSFRAYSLFGLNDLEIESISQMSLRNSLIPTLSTSSATQTTSSSTTHYASFHSSPVFCEKWKKKWSSNVKGPQQPSKNYIRYTTRLKRADTKRALNDLLSHTGSLRPPFQDESIWNFDGSKGRDNIEKKKRPKVSPGRGRKPHQKKTKRWHREASYSEDFDTENVFQATFGNRWYTWSFQEGPRFRNSSSEFEWREGASWTNHRTKDRDEADDKFSTLGSRSDRMALGLPPTGPLKMEDVKTAFRLSALKWHPDKHQDPSQETAEEKFKECVNAYKSLCAALA